MENKTIVITGASDGIGAEAARELHRHGHRVVLVGRSPTKTATLARELGTDHHLADFTSLEQVRRLGHELLAAHPRIDVLANNAGGVFGGDRHTPDGFEETYQVNHLSPFLLTSILLPALTAGSATVIQTSSVAARLFGNLDTAALTGKSITDADRAYGNGKLANILFTRELQRRHAGDGLNAVAFHPGFIASGFAQHTSSRKMRLIYNPLVRPFLKTAKDGAAQLVWLAEKTPGTDWEPGAYYERFTVARKINPQGQDPALARALWDASEAALRRTH